MLLNVFQTSFKFKCYVFVTDSGRLCLNLDHGQFDGEKGSFIGFALYLNLTTMGANNGLNEAEPQSRAP